LSKKRKKNEDEFLIYIFNIKYTVILNNYYNFLLKECFLSLGYFRIFFAATYLLNYRFIHFSLSKLYTRLLQKEGDIRNPFSTV